MVNMLARKIKVIVAKKLNQEVKDQVKKIEAS